MKSTPYDPTGLRHEMHGLTMIVVGTIAMLAIIILIR